MRNKKSKYLANFRNWIPTRDNNQRGDSSNLIIRADSLKDAESQAERIMKMFGYKQLNYVELFTDDAALRAMVKN